jgi:ribulose 1,5-bisphosphate synthetase/thiazole synthase
MKQRRQFIKTTLAGLPVVLLSPTLLASSYSSGDNKEPNGKTVIIVGAGISGLAAAKKIERRRI